MSIIIITVNINNCTRLRKYLSVFPTFSILIIYLTCLQSIFALHFISSLFNCCFLKKYFAQLKNNKSYIRNVFIIDNIYCIDLQMCSILYQA